MLKNLIMRLYPGITEKEIKKFGLLSVIFFLVIGSYWSLRLLKNSIFYKVAFPEELGWPKETGRNFIPIAKIFSLVFVFVMVIIYSKLIDKYKKHQLFYIICSFFGSLFIFIAGILFIKDVYGFEVLGKIFAGLFTNNYLLGAKLVLATTGWVSYFLIESFGSLLVALFWSFTSSITTTESAKHGYPLVITVAQIAAILGSIPLFFSEYIGTYWPILLSTSILVFSVIPAVAYFMSSVPEDQLVGNKLAAKTESNQEINTEAEKKKIKKEGFFQSFFGGLILLVTKTYLIGVFILSTFYEALGQIIEFQMQSLVNSDPYYGTDLGFGKFQSIYGMSINVLSFLISFLGTSELIRRFGVKVALIIYPASYLVVLSAILVLYLLGVKATILLWILFGIMVFVKGVGYAVSNPTKEIMYVPTSKDVKFKAKGWTDTFGSRLAKFGGSLVTESFKKNLKGLMLYGTAISFVLNIIWLAAAVFVGNKNSKLIKENKIIE